MSLTVQISPNNRATQNNIPIENSKNIKPKLLSVSVCRTTAQPNMINKIEYVQLLII